MGLFIKKRIEDLEERLVACDTQAMQKTAQFHNETNSFIKDMSKLLGEAVKQHHIVDSEHEILGELAD